MTRYSFVLIAAMIATLFAGPSAASAALAPDANPGRATAEATHDIEQLPPLPARQFTEYVVVTAEARQPRLGKARRISATIGRSLAKTVGAFYVAMVNEP